MDAVQWRDAFVSVTFTTLIRFITTLLAYEKNNNNGDKFDPRKSMLAADEKLIIKELGPYKYHLASLHINMYWMFVAFSGIQHAYILR